MASPDPFARRLDELASRGLDLVAFVASPSIDDRLVPLRDRREAPQGGTLGLLLIISRGGLFASGVDLEDGPDPLDTASAELADGLVRTFFARADPLARRVYPRPPSADEWDLRGWLERGGLQRATPFGIGVRSVCGPWFAVRAAIQVALDAPTLATLERRRPTIAPDPCVGCSAPCVDVCPVGAAQRESFDVRACATERLRVGSECATDCASRLACPFGEDFRYPAGLRRYHGEASLRFLRAWAASEGAPEV